MFSLSDKYPSIFACGSIGLLLVGLLFVVETYIIPLQDRKVIKNKTLPSNFLAARFCFYPYEVLLLLFWNTGKRLPE